MGMTEEAYNKLKQMRLAVDNSLSNKNPFKKDLGASNLKLPLCSEKFCTVRTDTKTKGVPVCRGCRPAVNKRRLKENKQRRLSHMKEQVLRLQRR